MLTTLTAVLDACVLYPAPLRDLLMQMAVTDLFRARWTAEIHEEWIRNLRAQRPDLDPKQLERTRDLMNLHARDGVVTGHMALVPALTLPDADDRHVLAAAIRSDAQIIVTTNLKDFPKAILDGHGLEAMHPDDFIADLLDSRRRAVCLAVKTARERLKKPPIDAHAHLSTLEAQGLVRTVERLREFVELL